MANKKATKRTGNTRYSAELPGNRINHKLTARFDVTDGNVGISQYEGPLARNIDRVLLTPAQFKALVAFVQER